MMQEPPKHNHKGAFHYTPDCPRCEWNLEQSKPIDEIPTEVLKAENDDLKQRVAELERWCLDITNRLNQHVLHHDNAQVPLRGAVR